MKKESQKLLWFGAMMTGPSSGIRAAPATRSRKYTRTNGTTSAFTKAYSGRDTPFSRASRCASSFVIGREPSRLSVETPIPRGIRARHRAPATPAEREDAPAPNGSDELEVHHLGGVTPPRAQLQDPRVAAGPPRVARCDLGEQRVHDELVLPERRERLAAGMQIAALGQRDELLELRLDRLGLRLGRLDPLMLDDLLAEVHEQRLAMRRVAAELVACLLVAHERISSLVQSARRSRPRLCSVSMTSSIDFLPKFGIALSSPSDFEMRSPTVWMPARFRQL